MRGSLKHFEEVDKMIQKSEIRDGMKIDWDVPITMDDGVVLRADVFRPIADGRYPVIMSHGCYGKGLAVQEGYAGVWESQGRLNPEIAEGSTNKYQNWEVVDPEKWVPDGYVCIRVDSRGAGRSPGYMDLFSLQEAKDYSICIEWAAVQPWSNGKIGLSGISYYAMNQWMVAQLKPPHLAAMLVWEGAGDFYLDGARHGGILCELTQNWLPGQVRTVQHGAGERGARSRVTGSPGRWRRSFLSRPQPRMQTCSWCCDCSILRAKKWCSGARPTPIPRWHRAGSVPHIESWIRGRVCHTSRITRMTSSGR